MTSIELKVIIDEVNRIKREFNQLVEQVRSIEGRLLAIIRTEPPQAGPPWGP